MPSYYVKKEHVTYYVKVEASNEQEARRLYREKAYPNRSRLPKTIKVYTELPYDVTINLVVDLPK